MKRYIKETEDIFCMTNLYPKRTGIPVILWVYNLGSARNAQHNTPRIKVQNVRGDKAVDDSFSVSIERDPKVLSGENKLPSKDWKVVKDYISRNVDVLLSHWNQESDEDDLKEILYKR